MTSKLTRIFALFRPCCKTDARCGWLPAAPEARKGDPPPLEDDIASVTHHLAPIFISSATLPKLSAQRETFRWERATTRLSTPSQPPALCNVAGTQNAAFNHRAVRFCFLDG
jgi:hypothetical protein